MSVVLVVDDDPHLLRTLRINLAARGYEVVLASDGASGLAQAGQRRPDLVIVDMQMGNMGGMATTLELRLEASYDKIGHVPVLMLLDRRPDVFLARRSGAEGWLVKPLDPIRLRRAVTALLDGGTYYDESYTPLSVVAAPSGA